MGKELNFKIRNSWGIYDIYKFIRKNHWYDIGRPLKEGEFYAIIRGVNKLLARNIAQGETVVFPENMGRLELRKAPRGVSFVNGKLRNSYPIDWASTKKLWQEDEEESRKKTLIRFEVPMYYSVKYCKGKALYNNKTFYQFMLNTFIRRELKENIVKGKADTLW